MGVANSNFLGILIFSGTQDWPVIDNAKLEYWDGSLDADGNKDWKTTDVSCINLVATNLSKLGSDHPIWPTIEPDDGQLAFSYIDGKVTNPRSWRRGVKKVFCARA